MASQTGPIKVLHVGLGPIGAAVVRQVAERKGFRIVGAADIDAAKAGRDLGEVAGVGRKLRIKVSGDVRKAIKAAKPDVVVLCTSSSLKRVLPQMQEIIKLKVPIVSTTEELAYPTKGNMKYARAIHELARKAKVAVLGTGVNPGFVMDALPAFLSAVALRVDAVHVERIQDAATRRVPFQEKIGAGLDLAQFHARVASGSLRHVGLGESLHFLAHCLGWEIEDWSETLEPVLAPRELRCALGPIRAGQPCGVRQTARARVAGRERMTFEFQAAIGQPEPRDRVRFESDPPLELLLPGGVHGDRATSAVLINCLAPLCDAAPGLASMASLRMPTCVARWP
jgi:hypothetical protein